MGSHDRRIRVESGALIMLAALLFDACTVPVVVRSFEPPGNAASLKRDAPYLKAHLRNGEVYILSAWNVDDAQGLVTGRGQHLDVNRRPLAQSDSYSVRMDDVVLFEANVLQRSKRIQSLAIMTGVSVVATTACLTSPKSCFGSRPTFYASDGKDSVLQAEGFSSSILPSLERRDIDALYRARTRDGRFDLRMMNEAQETHVVRYVRLLVAPRQAGARVFATEEGAFWRAREIVPPANCRAAEGDCTWLSGPSTARNDSLLPTSAISERASRWSCGSLRGPEPGSASSSRRVRLCSAPFFFIRPSDSSALRPEIVSPPSSERETSSAWPAVWHADWAGSTCPSVDRVRR